jgi:hypothetical protein
MMIPHHSADPPEIPEYRALRLASAAAYVSAPISHFISSEMIDLIETP